MKQLVERRDGDAFGTVRGVERWADGTVRYLATVSGPATGGRERELTLRPEDIEGGGEWVLLDPPGDEELSLAAPRSCVRCRRVNFGPCISATCQDLQAVS